MDDQMLGLLHAIAPLPVGVRERLLAKRVTRHFVKNQLLIEAGPVNNKMFFIGEGLVRCYYIKKGKEHTDAFLREGQLVAFSDSYAFKIPGIDYVEALEPCSTLMMTFDDLEEIYRDFPAFERNGRLITQRYSIFFRNQARQLRDDTVEERYQELMRTSPDILLRAPLKHVASFLSTSPEHLSRIRSKG